jgi:acetylornithine deacetylase/succinyl-diaminopimelate desuccinylase-like protein
MGVPAEAPGQTNPVQTSGAAQEEISGVVAAARQFRQAHEREIIDELIDFLSIPNVASDTPNIRRNAEWILAALKRRGLEGRLLETSGPPYVFAERRVPDARHTLLVYAHYDGQAVDPAQWTGHEPWAPVFRDGSLAAGASIVDLPAQGPIDPEWRIYARSASDDRSPIIMALTALDALTAAGIEAQSNIKFLFEGDEEAGSPNMSDVARRYRDLLAADLVLIADGPKHPSGNPTLTFGVRGITSVQITVYGPSRPLHSGHYGNWAPNPAMRLAQLLSTMKDPETGRVLVDGWYDDRVELTQTEIDALATIPDDPAQSPAALGFAAPEGQWKRRVEAITYPSLNVRGMRSGWVADEARTIVPDLAIAEIDLRLVVDIRPQDQVQRLIEHIRNQGFEVISSDPDDKTRSSYPMLAKVVAAEDGYAASRTSMDLPISRAVRELLRESFGVEPVAFPTSGGSVPLFAFTEILEAPTVGIPSVNHDNNQHSPNENLRIGNLWDGIEILAVLIAM